MSSRDALRSNSRIATSLLDALHAVGDVAGHNRVRRVFDEANANPRAAGAWLPVEVLDRAFHRLGRDRDFARLVGAGLVSNQRIGFVLFTEGMATIEKALRRCDSLFAREASDGAFAALEVGQGHARIVYRPGDAPRDDQSGASDCPHAPWNESFCGVRQGMLEALPLGFGLLPARVRETECVGDGDAQCCYEVAFSVRSLRFTGLGFALGTALGLGALHVAWSSDPLALPWAALSAVLLAAVGAVGGQAIDLARQLQVVAGARRGHLALLEQADRALAEKMDELAKLNAHGEQDESANAERLRAILAERESGRDEEGDDTDVHAATASGKSGQDERAARRQVAEQLYDALGPLQRGVERVHRLVRENREAYEDGGEAVFDALRGVAEESRRLATVGSTLAAEARGEAKPFDPVDLPEVITRAIDAVRPMLASEQRLEVAIEQPIPRVPCEPFQIEQVVYQLLRNAAEASDRDGVIELRLDAVPGGVECVVEDHGPGIPEEIVDSLFDPFALEGKPAGERGLGLAICYRIVTEHDGELRVASEAGEGTRMTVALRCDDRDLEA